MRELQNVIQRALLKLQRARASPPRPRPACCRPAPPPRGARRAASRRFLDGPEPEGGRYQAALAALEAPLIAAAMARTKGNQLRAAELLGMNRNTLRERMRALGMKAR